MRNTLYAKGVITLYEKQKLDKMINTEQMGELVDILIASLKSKTTKKYKGFLEAMEESDNVVLPPMAKKLGM